MIKVHFHEKPKKWIIVAFSGSILLFSTSFAYARLITRHEVVTTTKTVNVPVTQVKKEVKTNQLLINTNKDMQTIFHHQPTITIAVVPSQITFSVKKIPVGKQDVLIVNKQHIPVVYRGVNKQNEVIFTMYQKDKKQLNHQVNGWKLIGGE